MLRPEVESLIKSIASYFMKINVVRSTQLKDLDPWTDVQHHVPLHQTYIGLAATATLNDIENVAEKENIDKFLTECKNVFIESIFQIQSDST
jgi:hypothetical protein